MKPNILFIMIDSLRSDKCFGNKKTSKTPNIDQLIKNGAYFSQTISASDGTAPSWGSLFTSLYPFKSGIRGEIPSKLSDDITNFVDVFKNHGYNAYCSIPDYATSIGLGKPFQNDDKSYSGYDPLSRGFGEKIIEKLHKKTLKSPWLFFIHLLDLHWPFSAPIEFQDKVFGDTQYDKSVSAIDVWVGKFLKEINLDETLIILSADHGEYIPVVYRNGKSVSFEGGVSNQFFNPKERHRIPSYAYPIAKKIFNIQRKFKRQRLRTKLKSLDLSSTEKRYLSVEAGFRGYQNNIYDESIKIPLVFCGAGIKSHKIVSQQVRTIDIFPTLSELTGIEKITGIHGRSLVPLLEDRKMDELSAYIESNHRNECGEYLIGVRTGKYKYCREMNKQNNACLFDIENDSFEENNLVDRLPQKVTEFEKLLQEIIQDTETIKENTESINEEIVTRELKKLGYI